MNQTRYRHRVFQIERRRDNSSIISTPAIGSCHTHWNRKNNEAAFAEKHGGNCPALLIDAQLHPNLGWDTRVRRKRPETPIVHCHIESWEFLNLMDAGEISTLNCSHQMTTDL